MSMVTATARGLLPGLLVLSCILLWYRSSAGTWLLPSYWSPALLLDLQWWFAGALLAAVLLYLLRPRQARVLLLCAALLYLVQGIGWVVSVVTLLFFVAAWCLGRGLLLVVFPQASIAGFTLPLLPGLVLQLGIFGTLLHVPLNFPVLHLLLLLLPLVLLWRPAQRQELLQPLLACGDSSRNLLDRIPYVPCVLLLSLLAAVARYVLFPSVSGDDNAVHLRLWTELSWLHEYSFNVQEQIWSVAPFAVDLLHAVISLAATGDARGALNLVLYLLLLRQLWCVAGYWQLAPTSRLLLLALFASTPLLANLLLTLQTELFMALLASSGLRLLLACRSWYSAESLALAATAALACASKLPGAVLGLLLLLPALWLLWPLHLNDAARHGRRSIGVAAAFLLACAAVALHSYGVAWGVTGNPLFPLYNGIFQSPWNDPVNFSDGRWQPGFSLTSYWNVFFATSQHYESQDFVAGFQYLFLLPLGFVLLLRRLPGRHTWALGLPLFGFGLVMFANTQYWRYLFPVMPLATLAMAPLLMTPGQLPWQRGVATAAMLCCLSLNLWFLPGISYLMALPPGQVYTEAGRAAATLRYLPEKAFSAQLSSSAPGSTVLYQTERPFGAVLRGEPWYPMWYAPRRRDLATSIRSSAQLQQALQAEGITHVIWNFERLGATNSGTDLLREFLSLHGLPLRESAGVVLFALADAEPVYGAIWQGNEMLDTTPRLLHEAAAAGHTALRASGRFTCSDLAATIVLNLAWSDGTHTWRFLPCSAATLQYREALAVPPGAEKAGLTLFIQGSGTVTAENLTLELH